MFVKTMKLTAGAGLSVAWLALMSGMALADDLSPGDAPTVIAAEAGDDDAIADEGVADDEADDEGYADDEWSEDGDAGWVDGSEGDDADDETLYDDDSSDDEWTDEDEFTGDEEWTEDDGATDEGDTTYEDDSDGVGYEDDGDLVYLTPEPTEEIPGEGCDGCEYWTTAVEDSPVAANARGDTVAPGKHEWDEGHGPDLFARGNICLDDRMYVGWLCDWQRPYLGLSPRP